MSDDDVLGELSSALESDGPVSIGTMFRRPGIRVGGTIVAFLGHDGELILKVPGSRALELVEAGTAQPVTMGARTMREWVSVPPGHSHGETLTLWLALVREALSYVQQLREEEPVGKEQLSGKSPDLQA
jgi:TfoX/Sxy family transcriptional regulator of competence genes